MRQLTLVHYWTGLFASMRNTTPQTLAYAQHVLEEAQQLGDEELVALASVQLSRQLILLERMDNWQVLVLLFWLIETEHVKAFRPRQNSPSRIKQAIMSELMPF